MKGETTSIEEKEMCRLSGFNRPLSVDKWELPVSSVQ